MTGLFFFFKKAKSHSVTNHSLGKSYNLTSAYFSTGLKPLTRKSNDLRDVGDEVVPTLIYKIYKDDCFFTVGISLSLLEIRVWD